MKVKEIGNFERAKELLYGKENCPFSHVLSIDTNGLQKIPFHENCEITQIEFEDVSWPSHSKSPKPIDVKNIIKWAKELPEDANVFIHCSAGISRSTAAAIITTFIETESIEKSIEHVFSIRTQACPNPLIIYMADKFLNLNGKLIEAIEDEIKEKLIPYNLIRNAELLNNNEKPTTIITQSSDIYEPIEKWWDGLDEKEKSL